MSCTTYLVICRVQEYVKYLIVGAEGSSVFDSEYATY
jgi:hypothetical protein